MGSNLVESDGLLMAIKIHSMTSFGGQAELTAPCHNILQHVKDLLRYDRDTDRQNSLTFLPSFSLLYY
jgi:hypothetical protein